MSWKQCSVLTSSGQKDKSCPNLHYNGDGSYLLVTNL